MKFTKLDIDKAEELERTAEEKERAKKLELQSGLLMTACGLQRELLAVLMKNNATYNQARAALKGLGETYEALPYNLRGIE